MKAFRSLFLLTTVAATVAATIVVSACDVESFESLQPRDHITSFSTTASALSKHQRDPRDSRIRVLCLGDSITAGSHYDETDLTHPKIAWRGELYSEVLRLYGVELDLVGDENDNYAPLWWSMEHNTHHGGVISQLLYDPNHLRPSILSIDQRVAREVAKSSPDIVIILGGLNDLAVGYSVDEVVAHLQRVVSDVHAGAPKAEIVVSTITSYLPKLGESLELNRRILEGTWKVREPYERLVTVLDTTSGMVHPHDFSSDNAHPNRHGYEMMGARFAYGMGELLYRILESERETEIALDMRTPLRIQ